MRHSSASDHLPERSPSHRRDSGGGIDAADGEVSAAVLDAAALLTVLAALPQLAVVFAADSPRFTVLAASDALIAASQRPRAAIVGRPLAEAFPNASREDAALGGQADLRTSLDAAVQTGAPQRIARQRYDRQRPEGQWEARYWDALNVPVLGPDGAVRYILHQTEDVTAQVEGEAAAARAAQAECTAERILERVTDAHSILDREFRIVSVNAATEQVLGVSRETLVGRSHWDVFPASVDSPVGHAYRRVVEEGVEQHLTHRYTGEGYDFVLDVDAYPTDEGGVAIFWRDETERVRAEAALRESEERQAYLLTLSDALRDIHDPVDVQAAAARVLGERLGVDCAYYVEVDEARGEFVVEREWRRAEAPGHARRYPLAAWPVPWLVDQRAWVVSDVDVDPALPDEQRAVYRGHDIGAAVNVPLVKNGRLVASLAVNQRAPRAWTASEVALAEATAERTWAAVERSRAGVALRESELRYRMLFDAIDEGFCVIEVLFDAEQRAVDYRFIEANPAFVQQTGLVDAIGHTVRELLPDIEQRWIDTYGRVATTGEATRFQMGSDAMGRWFDVFASRTGRPEECRVALLFTDVSAARAAERERDRLTGALAVERERLASVFQQAASFLAVLRGPDHVFTLVNDAYYQLVGHRDILGKPAFEALPEVREQGYKELLDRVLATGEPFIGRELPFLVQRTPDAPPEERYVDLAYMPLVEPEDATSAAADPGTRGTCVTGVIAHGSDVTAQVLARREVERLLAESERARREAETARAAAETAQERAEEARREAAEANHAKSAFLATMSHELRTPINAMLGYTQLLDLGLAGPLTAQQRSYLERLGLSSQHLLGLVNDVLDLSRIEAGETRVAHCDAWTGLALGAALDLVHPQAEAKGVRLVDDRPDDQGVPYVGDEDRVRQILVNLLSNAVKFTEAGGTVTVTCDTVGDTPAASGRLQGEGPWAFVRVADTGVGIAFEEQRRIFEPFHQVEGGHTRTQGGTGLGLTISRRLARLMGGDLTVESQVGEGSVFTLWLPAARRTALGGSEGSWESAAERGARAERDLGRLDTPGLREIGELVRAAVDEIIAAYADRLRADPAIPRGQEMRRIQLEDHQGSLLADLAQSLVIVAEAGRAAEEEFKDGSAIQRTIANAHGARRHAQGWDEAAVRRDHQLFREEVARTVRARLEPDNPDAEAAVQVLLRLIDRAEAISVAGWRRAAGALALSLRTPANQP